MDLRNRLKGETQHLHDQMEGLPIFKKIVDQTITFEAYKALLEKFYGFIAPCERVWNDSPFQAIIKDREKTHLLEEDLIALGSQKSTLSAIPLYQYPMDITLEKLLGYLYVIEGSTLGGQIITRILRGHLQLSPEYGARFFYGYGKKTKEKWDEYCVMLNGINDSTQQEDVIQSAFFTYHAFYAWLFK